MKKNTMKKLLAAVAILTISIFTAGCDDDDSDRKRPTKHAHNDSRNHRDYDRDRDRNRDHRNDHKNSAKDGKNRPHKPRHDHRSDMVGEYSATALNDAVTVKGTTVYVDIVEDGGGELFLELPNGASYPISFANGVGSVAGGTIAKSNSAATADSFVYNDEKGGIWLVEKVD